MKLPRGFIEASRKTRRALRFAWQPAGDSTPKNEGDSIAKLIFCYNFNNASIRAAWLDRRFG
jgi:hypothetical protein